MLVGLAEQALVQRSLGFAGKGEREMQQALREEWADVWQACVGEGQLLGLVCWPGLEGSILLGFVC